jgi:hypothetical protein
MVTVRAGTASDLIRSVVRSDPFLGQATNTANKAHYVGRNATEVEPFAKNNNNLKIIIFRFTIRIFTAKVGRVCVCVRACVRALNIPNILYVKYVGLPWRPVVAAHDCKMLARAEHRSGSYWL